MSISRKCNNCLSFNQDCAGMSSNFTGCIYYKKNDKRIFEHYKKRLTEGDKARFNVIQYICRFPNINPYEMAAALMIDGCEITFDDSSISSRQNESHKKAVESFRKAMKDA